jgi:hypothetical protein
MVKAGEVGYTQPSSVTILIDIPVVVRTGDHTLIGQIAALTGGESGNESPLSKEM